MFISYLWLQCLRSLRLASWSPHAHYTTTNSARVSVALEMTDNNVFYCIQLQSTGLSLHNQEAHNVWSLYTLDARMAYHCGVNHMYLNHPWWKPLLSSAVLVMDNHWQWSCLTLSKGRSWLEGDFATEGCCQHLSLSPLITTKNCERWVSFSRCVYISVPGGDIEERILGILSFKCMHQMSIHCTKVLLILSFHATNSVYCHSKYLSCTDQQLTSAAQGDWDWCGRSVSALLPWLAWWLELKRT